MLFVSCLSFVGVIADMAGVVIRGELAGGSAASSRICAGDILSLHSDCDSRGAKINKRR